MLTLADVSFGLAILCLLLACAITSAVFLQRRYFPAEERSERLATQGTLAAVVALYPTLILGFAGALRPWPLVLIEAASALTATFLWLRAGRPSTPRSAPIRRRDPALLVLLIVFGAFALYVAGFGLVHPPLAWDDLFYHLPKVVEWLQDGAIRPLYHPQGPYPSYYPASSEAFALWTVLPFGNDLLAGFVNLPFLALAGVATYCLAKDAGAPSRFAALAPLCFLFTPCVARLGLTQHAEPLVVVSALLTLHFSLRAARTGLTRDLALCGLAAGLLASSKVTGPIYAAVAVLPALFALSRARRPLVALCALAASAAPGLVWLVQNALLTGNPVYPLPLFGLPGIALEFERISAGGRLLELVTEGHLWRALIGSSEPPIYESGIGWKVVPIAIAFGLSLLGLRRAAQRAAWVWLVVVALAWAALFAVTPVYFASNVYQNVRFLAPALALVVAICVAALSERRPRLAVALGASCLATDLFALVRDGSEALWLALCGALAAALVLTAGRFSRQSARVRRTLLAAAVPAAAALCFGLHAAHEAREAERHDRYARDWSTVQTIAPRYAPGWRFFDAQAKPDARVAFHGFDFMYPVYGPRLARRVRYVDVNARAGGAYHRYERGAHRNGADAAAFLRNLETFGAQWLYLERRPWDRAFPEERVFADERPARFALAFENGWTRIYRLTPGLR